MDLPIKSYPTDLPNSTIFCNNGWFNLEIRSDGSYGSCCNLVDKDTLYHKSDKSLANIKSMSFDDWHNSKSMKSFRLQLLGDEKIKNCSSCYKVEHDNAISKRLNDNYRSVIFSKNLFLESYNQSHHKNIFEYSKLNQGITFSKIKEITLDLGNLCNLACKMCDPSSSSVIANQYHKWKIIDKNKINVSWAIEDNVWRKFLEDILSTDLEILSLRGGEPLYNKKTIELLEFLIRNNKTNIHLDMTTNGTIYNEKIWKIFDKFQSISINVSIETANIAHNNYIRQGSNTEDILENIIKIKSRFSNHKNFTLNLSYTLTSLSIFSFVSLINFSLDHDIVLSGRIISNPDFFDVKYLPEEIKRFISNNMTKMLEELDNKSPIDNFTRINKIENSVSIIKNIISYLNLENTNKDISNQKVVQLVNYCKKWDRNSKFNFDAVKIFPELAEIFIKNGYYEN